MARFSFDGLNEVIQEQVSKRIEALVQVELAKVLKAYGIGIRDLPREHNNNKKALIEGNNLRRHIGDLLKKQRINKQGNIEVQFRLKGPRARKPEDAVDYNKIIETVMKNVMKKLGR